MRKSFSKKIRQQIAEKTNNHCGYCGIDLPEKWHLDHIEPICSNYGTNELDNLIAACPECNLFKSGFRLEQFRSELEAQGIRALKYSVNARMAQKYGIIKVFSGNIKFYFEELKERGVDDKD